MAPIKKTPASATPAPAKDAAAKPAAKEAKPAAVAKDAKDAKDVKPAKEAKAAAAPVADVPAVDGADVVEAVEAEPNAMMKLATKIQAAAALMKEIQIELKAAQKEFDKMTKTKLKAEKKRANARTSPSGFAKPTKISDELCVFLSVAKGTEMARTEVTRKLNAYIKENSLFNVENKRIILPNASLKKLLGCGEEEVSFFNIQRFMKRHFIKAVAPAATA
jgi:chromatin remodeling complex protein RSC6